MELWPGFIAFLAALFAAMLADLILRLPAPLPKTVASVGIAFSSYSVINGIYHALVTWEFIDLFGKAQTENAHLDAKRGFALLVIQF